MISTSNFLDTIFFQQNIAKIIVDYLQFEDVFSLIHTCRNIRNCRIYGYAKYFEKITEERFGKPCKIEDDFSDFIWLSISFMKNMPMIEDIRAPFTVNEGLKCPRIRRSTAYESISIYEFRGLFIMEPQILYYLGEIFTDDYDLPKLENIERDINHIVNFIKLAKLFTIIVGKYIMSVDHKLKFYMNMFKIYIREIEYVFGNNFILDSNYLSLHIQHFVNTDEKFTSSKSLWYILMEFWLLNVHLLIEQEINSSFLDRINLFFEIIKSSTFSDKKLLVFQTSNLPDYGIQAINSRKNYQEIDELILDIYELTIVLFYSKFDFGRQSFRDDVTSILITKYEDFSKLPIFKNTIVTPRYLYIGDILSIISDRFYDGK